ncbi:MAG: 1-acyl-sn-glycerol-3-phosphate acyltransferase [Campylobacterales bacterium]|nr:1-acyl-sn-glycerol-3-phosphate acyltransferase [Campylobacterales bacterium]
MFKNLGKYMFMVELGFKYITIFKKTFFHPFINYKSAYRALSKHRQAYSNKVLEFLNIDVNLIGEVPQHNKVLYAINHRSLLDIIVMENIFYAHKKNGTWIAKQELFDNIFYGKFFQYSGCISVDLESKKGLLSFFKSIKTVLTKVDDMNIYIFPEGERFKGAEIHRFQSGASKIAKANGLEVIPVFIDDKLEKVFANAPYAERYTVDVYMGQAIDSEKLEEEYREFYKLVKKESNK